MSNEQRTRENCPCFDTHVYCPCHALPKEGEDLGKRKVEVFIVGTRPEIIKMAPILLRLERSEYFLIHTGQHRELATEALDTFGLKPDCDLALMTEDQSLSSFAQKAFAELTRVLENIKENTSRVWVQGDTSTAYIGAVSASLLKIPIVHVEAGLRTFDNENPWPEEMFRTQIDILSDMLFAPTEHAKANLNVGLSGKIHVTGNTIVDALEIIKKTLPDVSPCSEPYVLATIHRRESFGPELIEIFSALKELSKTIKVILPAHPNPKVREALESVGLDFIEPLSYKSFLHHLKFCEYAITDSGGVQEEAPSFGKRTIVLRKKTERIESLDAGYSALVSQMTKESILTTIEYFAHRTAVFSKNPFGDGHAAERILEIIKQRDGRTNS